MSTETSRKWFVFVDTAYYPYVADPVEAETAPEAMRLASESLRLGERVFVAPMDAVMVGEMQGPETEPQGLHALMLEHNRLRDDQITAGDLHGGFSVVVEGGSVKP